MEPLIRDPRLRKLTFTGSTEVGRTLIQQSASQVLRISMELGGNAPFVVFADADLDAAVEGAMIAKLRNGGQACTAANRFIVHRLVAEEFGRLLTKRMNEVSIGRGDAQGVELGPMIDARAMRQIAELIDDAKANGARMLTHGRIGPCPRAAISGSRPYYPVPPRSRECSPVAAMFVAEDDQECIDMANDTEYDLVAYVYTQI